MWIFIKPIPDQLLSLDSAAQKEVLGQSKIRPPLALTEIFYQQTFHFLFFDVEKCFMEILAQLFCAKKLRQQTNKISQLPVV
jgi:hypothetical protein